MVGIWSTSMAFSLVFPIIVQTCCMEGSLVRLAKIFYQRRIDDMESELDLPVPVACSLRYSTLEIREVLNPLIVNIITVMKSMALYLGPQLNGHTPCYGPLIWLFCFTLKLTVMKPC